MSNKNNLELDLSQIQFLITEDQIALLKNNTSSATIIGQDRALQALDLGLGLRATGYNIFVMGASGTGRRTILTSLLKDYKPNFDDLQDIAYVYNFARPLEPIALFFTAGTGNQFKKSLQTAIESIRKQALQITKSEVFSAASKKIQTKADLEENQLLASFEEQMNAEGFKLKQIKDDEAQSLDLLPVYKGKPVSFDMLQDLVNVGKYPAQQLTALKEHYFECLDQMGGLFKSLREKRRQTEKQLRVLKTNSCAPIIDNELSWLISLYQKDPKHKEILAWLKNLREDLLLRSPIYTEPFKTFARKKKFFNRYAINLICEHPAEKNYIIQEELPTFANLFGAIETTENQNDGYSNSHLCIRGGAVHRAMGGFLVLRLQDVIIEEGSWLYLKRVLQSGKVEIQNSPTSSHLPSLIKPQPIPIRLKVILIGGELSYDFLYQEDPDFQKLFKICAEFDSTMPRTDINMSYFISFIEQHTIANSLLPIDNSGLARILRYAARLAEDRTRITSQFVQITDLLQEANFHAKKNGETCITSSTITKTIEYKQFLQKLPEEKYKELIHSREIIIDVKGKMVGKVNGLAVHDRGYLAFGIPVAVTAQAAPGNKGVINIERESGLSGEIYDKAHLIIQGLLHRKYAKDIPLAVSASICFEQSYTEVDGDSASCAAFFALVSAIANIPLRQDIAITGSLNQLGDVQPVGGISEKIEGFFNACTILGLTGTQGVIIPARNINNLIVSERIEQAVMQNLFHIWTINTVEEGIALMSDMPADEFSTRVYQKLSAYAQRMHQHLLKNE